MMGVEEEGTMMEVGDDNSEDNDSEGNDRIVFFKPSSDLRDINGNLGDGLKARVRKCNSRSGCQTCLIFKPSDYVSSSVTHRTYKVVNSDPLFCDCSSSHLVYLLTCDCCGLQYFGETYQELRKRMSKHKTDIFHGKGSCPYLIKHFNNGPCSGATFSVRVLEKMLGSGRLTQGGMDSSKVSDR